MQAFNFSLKVAIDTVGGFVAQVLIACLIGLLIVAVSGANDDLRMSGAYLIGLSMIALIIPRLFFAAIISTVCNTFVAERKRAFLAALLINGGAALTFGLFAAGLFGRAL